MKYWIIVVIIVSGNHDFISTPFLLAIMALLIFFYLVTIVDWSALMDKMGAMVFPIVTLLLNSVTLIVYRQWINKKEVKT
ncbi:hypothetical protein ACQCVN_07295 [Rossellomorea aquimaris]